MTLMAQAEAQSVQDIDLAMAGHVEEAVSSMGYAYR